MDFSELYRRYAPDVHRFALYLAGRHSDADDITAETFARVWASPETVRMVTVKAYLFTIARNLHRQGARIGSRHVALDESAHDQQFRDPGAGPLALAAQDEELRHTLIRLQDLPEISRAALLMHAVDGMPYEEIAAVLQLSLPAVKVRIHRARLALAGVDDGTRQHTQRRGR